MRLRSMLTFSSAVLAGIGSMLGGASGSPLKSDEHLWFFPTTAAQSSADAMWHLPVHGWVFEIEGEWLGGLAGLGVRKKLRRILGAEPDAFDGPLFFERVKYFGLVDNESGKSLTIRHGDQSWTLPDTLDNGHVYTNVELKSDAAEGSWITYSMQRPGDGEIIKGEAQLIPPAGLSVISDVDDTIKDSNVLDKKALLRNTFVEPYRTTEGMPAYYQDLRNNGAFFHYVSASPWRLYPSLKPFMDENYPKGSVHFRHFRLSDGSFLDFMGSSEGYKLETITALITRYPAHRFVLIGDSGEHDPEIYAEIYAKFPDAIDRILIRNVDGSDISDERLGKAFEDVPAQVWQTFNTPADIR